MPNDECKTYLGTKGYSIYKNKISVNEQQYIRDQLMVRPYVPKAPVQPQSFPIYLESPNKLYVPRYFGEELYGKPDEYRIGEGDDINLEFKGELRDFQKDVVNKFLKSVDDDTGCGGGLLDIPCGFGKTILALNIISRIKKKTLVIVHKTFLLNQWMERIEQFLPDAKVGSIQGQVIDMEGKDIVIGMLQSLSMKSYPSDLFSCFGLTITDETHHLGSEVFSQALQKIVTPVTLGLSATMQRKDGLTHVFKMFLGDIVYKMKRESEDDVLVKAITYNVDDEEYNKVKYDGKGNPQHSSMISKVCGYNRRSEFILSVIKQELAEKPDQQIMVLAQQKNILIYLDKAIKYHNVASAGFYVGGMKEEDLKETETKKIVLATYAMAAEGLDIKTLTSMILASPRTDITQSVGRILRVKHERPLVVDIIDSHDVFRRQWEKRLAFYKKNKYKVLKTTNEDYKNNNWETVYEKTMKVEKKKKEKVCMVDL
mgnify:CR=1 FL=1